MPNQHNIDQVSLIKNQVEKAKSIIFVDYSGLDVAAQTKLRAQIANVGGEFTVQKNTLLKLALKDNLELTEELTQALNGPTAALYGYQDAVSAVKALTEFIKENESLKIKIGILKSEESSAKILTTDQVQSLATLPGRQELYAMLLMRLNSPVQGFYNVLQGNLRGLVQVINAIKDAKTN